jgi:hypothetical protein
MIYILDRNPGNAARALADEDLKQLIRPLATLICSTHVMCDGFPTAQRRLGAMMTEIQNPMTIFSKWAAHSTAAYYWLCSYYVHAVEDLQERIGQAIVASPFHMVVPVNCPELDHMRLPPQKLPLIYSHEDPVEAYRNYYFCSSVNPKWSPPDTMPSWFMMRYAALLAVDTAESAA